jgi:hypothetical protein
MVSGCFPSSYLSISPVVVRLNPDVECTPRYLPTAPLLTKPVPNGAMMSSETHYCGEQNVGYKSLTGEECTGERV